MILRPHRRASFCLGLLIVCVFALPACKKDEKAPTKASTAEPAKPAEKALIEVKRPNIEGASRAKPRPPAAPPTAEKPPVAPAEVSPTHQFYGVYVSGQKAGWAEERVTLADDGAITLTMAVHLRIARMGQAMDLSIADEVHYAPLPAGTMTGFTLVQNQPGGGKAIHRGVVKEGKLEVTVTAEGATTTKVMDIPRETAADTLPKLIIQRLRNSGDKPITTWQYDRQMLRDIPVETRILSEKKTTVQGVPTTILEVRGVDSVRNITMTNRLAESGRTLEMAIGPGLKLVLEDEKVARNPALSVPDLYRLSAVPVDKPLGTASLVDKLVVELDGLPDGMTLSDGRQTLDGKRLTIVRRPVGELPVTSLTAEQKKRWTEATAFVDHEDAGIRALAATATVGSGTPGERIAAMTRLVHQKLAYTLATAPLTASEILKGGRGDCTEYARLMVAVARAAGFAAREVSGMAYAGDTDPGFAFHAWAEVFIPEGEGGRWVAADPTWNQIPPDATHIALSRDDPSAIVGLLGAIKARVISLDKR